MTVDEILNTLTHCEGAFPTTAVQAAVEQKDAIIPRLLAHLQRMVDLGDTIDENDEDPGLTLFAVYLLAQFQEPRAYPLVVRLVSDWDDAGEFHLGDAITEGFGRILASVCHGDIGPIQMLVENDGLDEFVRAAALAGLVTLYSEQVLSREDLQIYFTYLFRQHPTRKSNHLWDCLVIYSEALRLTDLLPDIRQAYKERLASNEVVALKDVEKNIHNAPDEQLELSGIQNYITDTTAELSHWASFQPEERTPYLPTRSSFHGEGDYQHDGNTTVRPDAKVGRNEPCPCGSGKKFKKCCGG